MHICFVTLWHPPALTEPDALAEWDATRRGLGAALVRRGHRVTVVQEFHRAAQVERDGVVWELVPPSAATTISRRLLTAVGPVNAVVRAPAPAILAPVAQARPDIIHAFDLAFYPTMALLGQLARRLRVPLVAHFHGGAPARNRAYRWVERYALDRVDRLLFTTRSHGEAWVRSGALDAEERIAEVFETSTFLAPVPVRASKWTEITKKLVYLCVGRLDPVKDPLTTIEGFARIVRARPHARLIWVWTDAPLVAEVRARIAQLGIADRVELRGPVPRAQMAALYASADYLLQSSVREVCGVAVIEALAMGVTPIVTDIPSFRRLTDDGRHGRLFPRGDAVALAAQALSLEPESPDPEARFARAEATRSWFAAALSFDALAAEVDAVYRELVPLR